MAYFLDFLEAFRCSESAIAIACLGLVTLGPFLDPLCNSPFLNSSITTLTFFLDFGTFLLGISFFILFALGAFFSLCIAHFLHIAFIVTPWLAVCRDTALVYKVGKVGKVGKIPTITS